MSDTDKILDIYRGYDRDKLSIATIGSHSALQILNGAKAEGFKSIVLCKPERVETYRRFGVADKIITLNSYDEILEGGRVYEKLIAENAIIVLHGSFISNVGTDKVEKRLTLPILGNRDILRWDSDRTLERDWLLKAGIKMPKETKDPKDIDRLSIVKFPGARGGRGYFLVANYEDFVRKTAYQVDRGRITRGDIRKATIQEYISGVSMYLSYFYSPLKKEVELFGIDQRLESNIDGLTRIPALDQTNSYIEPSYVVVGNVPIVVRESLIPRIFEMGDSIVKVSKKLAPPGMMGPFCLETIVTHDLEFIAFEISARIVAGTNPFIGGSPYSYLTHGRGMSIGRRIARELKLAMEGDKEEVLIT